MNPSTPSSPNQSVPSIRASGTIRALNQLWHRQSIAIFRRMAASLQRFVLLLMLAMLADVPVCATEHLVGVAPGDDKTVVIQTTELGERHDLIVRNDNHPATHNFVTGKDPGDEIVGSSDTALWFRDNDTVHTKNYTVIGTQPGDNLWLHVRLSFTPRAGGGGGGAAPPDADIRVPGAFLVSLTFSGEAPDEYHPVYRDPYLVPAPDPADPPIIVSNTLYDPPHWHRDREADPNEHQFPVCYKRNVRMVVGGEWELVPPEAWPNGPYVVTGYRVVNQLPGPKLVEVTATATAGSLVITDAVFEDPLPDTVHYEEALPIHWTISAPPGAEGAAAVDAGRSDNELYVVLDVPIYNFDLDSFYRRLTWHSLLHLACSTSNGADDLSSILDGVWPQFTMSVINPGVSGHDSQPLRYYDDWTTLNYGALQLLAHGDSQCSGFPTLLLHALRIHGLSDGEYAWIASGEGNDHGFLVNNWTFIGAGSSIWPGFPDYTHANTYDPVDGRHDSNSYLWTAVEIQDEAGIRGQNNPNPKSHFQNHQVALIDGRYYDASYGKIFDDLDEVQAGAIGGFYRILDDVFLTIH